MSRSSKGFADFFPTAPSVLQQKRSKASQDRKTHHSLSACFPQPSLNLPPHPASLDGKSQATTLTNGLSNGDLNTIPTSLTHEESDCINADVAHEVGSSSSTSTASSMFSAGRREANMVYQHGPHKSTSLTPLTNIDSSPRANSTNSPQKTFTYDQHLSFSNPPKSPSGFHMSESHASIPDLAPLPSRLQARPGRGEVKGFKAIYDPDLDKSLRGKERKSRQAQFEPFGEEVRLALLQIIEDFILWMEHTLIELLYRKRGLLLQILD